MAFAFDPFRTKCDSKIIKNPHRGTAWQNLPFKPCQRISLKIARVDDVGLPEEAVGTGNGEVIPLLDLSVDVKRHPKGNRLLAVGEN